MSKHSKSKKISRVEIALVVGMLLFVAVAFMYLILTFSGYDATSPPAAPQSIDTATY